LDFAVPWAEGRWTVASDSFDPDRAGHPVADGSISVGPRSLLVVVGND
jgi:hypothetical protein